MPKRIQELERDLRAAGHQVERTYEAPVESRQQASDAEWVFRVDGKVVARGGAMSELEEALRRWIAASGILPSAS